MTHDFIDEEIVITLSDNPFRPAGFSWRGANFPIRWVLDVRFDYGWGPLRYSPKRWWQRRHRTYYRVQTESGERFELYNDRALGRWVLYRRLS